MSEVIRLLRQDHANLAKLLEALERQLAKFDTAGKPDYEIIEAILDYCRTYPDLHHHPREDLVFRKLQERNPGAAAAVGDQEAEHAIIDRLTARFAEAVRNVLNDLEVSREAFDHAARAFIDNYWRHMTMEERVFFPRALEELTDGDWQEIEAALVKREDPLFSKQVEERYEELRKHVLAWDREERQGPTP